MASTMDDGTESTGGESPDEVTNDHAAPDQIYTPLPGELHFSWRAVITGCIIGSVVAAMNLYLGLRTGWSLGGSLIAAIAGFAVMGSLTAILPKMGFKNVKKFGVLETNITQTTGSAAGSMTSAAGMLAAIPAMGMLGVHLSYLQLTLWALSVAYLGVFFAVPLRKQMVVSERLRFPTGTATAETIVSMASSGKEAATKARTLALFGLLAGVYALAFYFIPELEHPPIGKIAVISVVTVWGFSLLMSPMMFGAGILIGPRIGTSLVLGALLSWGVLAPLLVNYGLVAGPFLHEDGGWVAGHMMSFSPLTSERAAQIGAPESMIGMTGARAWLLWPGVALMIADALTSLALNWRSVLNTFMPGKGDSDAVDLAPDQIPAWWWMSGLGVATVFVTIMAWWLFEIPPLFTIIAVALSAVLATIAVRSTGETDINPIGGMGKVTQLAFAAISPGAITTNLMSAAITGAGASQAGDMMQDLKTGYLLGASPKRQFVAQLIGIGAGIIVCVPAYMLFDAAYDIGGMNQDIAEPLKALPAPAAHAWKGFAELLAGGLDSLPTGAIYAVIAGLILGALLSIVRHYAPDKLKNWVPSGLAVGIAFIVPAYYAVIMWLGSMFLVGWNKISPNGVKALAFAVASGLVAGEGLMGVVSAILQISGVPTLWQMLGG
ncbi:MAG: OPT family oligopeptide transporter [Kiritimatiellia bacterium]|jgi:OPT family oligopeptide transporter